MSGGSAGAALPSDVSWPVMGRAIRQGGEPHWHPPGPLMSDALTGDYFPHLVPKHPLRREQGKRFYSLAAQETDQAQWRPALEALAEKFTFARRALNTLSDRYLKTQRTRYFRVPTESR
ncbi:MAG: hypothetical protein WB586_31450 [Chthoniobacterales bacterium]